MHTKIHTFCFILTCLAFMPLAPLSPLFANASTLDAALQDMCDRKIILLGENGHGDGNSPAFKTTLTKRLVKECGFNRLVFEASFYDGMKVMQAARLGTPVSEDMVKSAMASIRNNTKGIAPLIPFVRNRVQAGTLTLAGIDDQISVWGSFYALGDMGRDLTAYLPEPRAGQCEATLKQRFWYQYSEDAPYDENRQKPVLTCLDDIKAAIQNKTNKTTRGQDFLAVIASINRRLAREFTGTNDYRYRRDQSMFENFSWLMDRFDDGIDQSIDEGIDQASKTIIWTVNAHAAKDTSGFKPFRDGKNIGILIAEKYGADQVYALGFTAPKGTYRFGRTVKEIPKAPANSLEHKALQSAKAPDLFLNKGRLREMGAVPSNLYIHEPAVSDWSKAFDGVIVFARGKPTELVR
ncbi:erythromycin esterase family protein [Kordiimonas sp. SCSIO 12610]|uniref:erythromycin esterase family protein n=1 Tax=Kordiimonas sp. SCSIO 12610 TaxID=2829597 RepID=UPI0021090FC1|nr:erythromycin esterase family protein [Kordiimonas sp. SCSIO 12610]UTW56121.1 erythromycin esterase family protein [Kordiimonas sp. SCSIO 12610]